ncbi:hypothetical protein B0H10DRAFT_1957013 [Mycena sp. CBHHK59/15]|nr:hypothetical protein B0H10DRAFT_1957013 [Mycena sp. CBHHK59/15]
MTLNPPTPASLDAIRDGIFAGSAIASQILEQQQDRGDAYGLPHCGAGNKFRDGLKLGEKYARAGAEVANSAGYTLEEFAAGKVEDKDIQDIARTLEEPVTELLDNANKMQEHWGLILTELENVWNTPQAAPAEARGNITCPVTTCWVNWTDFTLIGRASAAKRPTVTIQHPKQQSGKRHHLLLQFSMCRVYTIMVLFTLLQRDGLRKTLDGQVIYDISLVLFEPQYNNSIKHGASVESGCMATQTAGIAC